jgi:1-acyl-sn-glycerol-3-phosphate acyltransferase
VNGDFVAPHPALPAVAGRGRLQRRLVTVPFFALGLWVVVALFPALFLLALTIDLARLSKTFSTTRLCCLLLAFLVVENTGFVLLLFTWLTTAANSRERHARTFAVQRLYTAGHLASVKRLFSLRFVVENAELAATGPLLVFVRHASLVDVLVPGGFIANTHRLQLRYVLKKELLVEPCLDIAGHWIPNHFVDRSGSDSQAEFDALRALKAGIGPNEGVILYPEGTRFSRSKRRSVIEKLEGASRERAEQVKHLLPIRRGGALTLLDASPHCDVLFVGHHGLEGLTRLKDIWRGTLVGKTVTITFWREPAAEVPTGEEARMAWLHQKWQRLDAWLEQFE